jgi:hypothetical protein
MAVLVIEEYADVGRNGVPVPLGPPVAVQQITLGGSSTASNAFNSRTRYVLVRGTGDCRVQIASSPTAIDDGTCIRIPSGTEKDWAVSSNSGLKIAAITAA